MPRRKTQETTRTCDFCYTKKDNSYGLFKVILKTNKSIYEIALKTLLEQLNAWVMSKLYHLSATEIILLRPDLLHDFFKETRKDERIVGWLFKEYIICLDCYEQYKKNIPAR